MMQKVADEPFHREMKKKRKMHRRLSEDYGNSTSGDNIMKDLQNFLAIAPV